MTALPPATDLRHAASQGTLLDALGAPQAVIVS
jgi:hypothetical protein